MAEDTLWPHRFAEASESRAGLQLVGPCPHGDWARRRLPGARPPASCLCNILHRTGMCGHAVLLHPWSLREWSKIFSYRNKAEHVQAAQCDKWREHTEKSQHPLPAKGCTPLAASVPHLIAARALPTWARLCSVTEERPRMPCTRCTLPSACERRGPKREPPLPRGSHEVELLRLAWRRRRRWMSPS